MLPSVTASVNSELPSARLERSLAVACGVVDGLNDDEPADGLLALCSLAARVCARRESLQREVALGYAAALAKLRLRYGPEVQPAIPGGMLEALCIAGELGRPTQALDHHYTRGMPAQLAQQLRSRGGPDERLFSARLDLRRLPRLRAALEALFSLVAGAGLDCAKALGAATPALLFAARPTLGELYAGCHFGSSMPMLYAWPGDLTELAAARSIDDWIDQRYAGPLAHELAHLHPLDEALVPAPANLHEAFAAWLGSEAWPEQMFPRAARAAGVDRLDERGDAGRGLANSHAHSLDEGGLDALPGGPWFAAVGAWVARAISPLQAIRAQAGALDLRDALGPACAEALRLHGWLAHLETSAPHLLADTFAPARWWKLVDLHRDPLLAAEFHAAHVTPLLSAPPPRLGTRVQPAWDAALDALPWRGLPSWRDPPGAEDDKLAMRACHALGVRTVLRGMSFRAERTAPPPWTDACGPVDASGRASASEPIDTAGRPDASRAGARVLGEGPLRLDVEACLLRANHARPDAVGAPPSHPYPPALCALYARAGFTEVRGDPEGGLPAPPPLAQQDVPGQCR
jgi:hypothetical protein